MKSKHAELLNSLDAMQQSPAYALRRDVLSQAEQLIVRQEESLDSLQKLADQHLAQAMANGQSANALRKQLEKLVKPLVITPDKTDELLAKYEALRVAARAVCDGLTYNDAMIISYSKGTNEIDDLRDTLSDLEDDDYRRAVSDMVDSEFSESRR
jgi:hypothetical protein